MKIKKRDGRLENLSLNKISDRLKKLQNDKRLTPLKTIDVDIVTQKVVSSIYDGVSSTELDEEAARTAIQMTENLEYGLLASRIIISNVQKNTLDSFSDTMELLYANIDSNNEPAPILSDKFMQVVRNNKEILDKSIDYQRDYLFDYFGYKTLEKSYLMKIKDKIIERPQHLYMRVAIQVHLDDISNVLKTYEYISQHFFTFASPILFNSGTRLENLISCFLLGTEDSVKGMYKTITDCAQISKVGGGIGIHIDNIRSKGSVIRGTNGISDGIIPMLKVYNATCLHVNQSGRRKGSFAMYLSPVHPDIFEFLDLRKNQGSEDMRARDLFLALWTPDLFMKQVECDGDWYLIDPDECKGLNDTYGDDFDKLYWDYVEKGKYKKKVKAQDIWMKVLESQIETGTPYILYKDNINKMSNQKNIGTIKSSNLCAEIALYSDDSQYACCFTGDTQILTKEGYKRIDECDNTEVYSYFNNDVDFKKRDEFVKAKLIDNGIKDVYELQCTLNSVVKVTEDHLFAVRSHDSDSDYSDDDDKYIWKKAKDLDTFDEIVYFSKIGEGDKMAVYEFSVRMISFKYIGKEHVYDLNVPKTHNFVANNFAVHNCNLLSLALPKYVNYDNENKPYFDHDLLFQVAKHTILPMNNVIDNSFYPVPETKLSNDLHRPIGVGVQGLWDVYVKMRLAYESPEAEKLNREIFETIYFACLSGSLEMSKKDGMYSSFDGSPFSEGKFQFDLWAENKGIDLAKYLSGRWDWETLRKEVKEFGVRNSTLTTCMPTASSAQIMGNTESFEVADSCIFKRRVLSGEYTVINKYLIKDLTELGLWNNDLKNTIIANNGSIQNIEIIPDDLKLIYKTIWEISMKNYIKQSAERSPFIDMTQSLNLFMASPTIKKLSNMHFFAWKQNLKTGIYYLRSRAGSSAAKFSIDPVMEKKIKEKQKKGKSLTKKEQQVVLACSLNNPEACDMCSS